MSVFKDFWSTRSTKMNHEKHLIATILATIFGRSWSVNRAIPSR
jgi:hypothetical protein